MRETITEYVRREVDAGHITDRAGVETYLKAQGYALPRTGKDYLTVLAHGERIRLKGGLYRVEHWNPHDHDAPRIRYGHPDPERAAALAVKLERLAAARAAFHRSRYSPRKEPPHEHERIPPDLATYLQDTLGPDVLTPTPPNGDSPLRQRRERRHATTRHEQEEEQEHGLDRPRSGALGAPG